MLEESTKEYNAENYVEAISASNLITYSLEGYGDYPGTIYMRDPFQTERLLNIREKSHEKLSDGWNRLAKL